MIFFTSDTHLNHNNIIKYCQRPYSSVEDMNEQLIKNWNYVVKPNDTVYHLGDVAFMPYKDFKNMSRSLNGKKNLILGNHDQMLIQHEKDLLSSGTFNSIQRYLEIKIDNQMIVLFHFGQRVWNKSHHGSIHLYGHSHGNLPPHGKSVDVGVDCKEITEEYRPVSLDEVLSYMSKRDIAVVDHHNGENHI